MESNRLTARAMLQKVITLTKHTYDLRSSSNLLVPNSNSETTMNPITFYSPYLLSPPKKFDFHRAQKILQMELNRRCSRLSTFHHYNPKQCLDLVGDLSQQLRRALRSDLLNHFRYKIVVLVTIVQVAPDRHNHQAVAIASRCLWDCQTDGSITAQSPLGYDMSVIATAFAVYTE